MATTGQPGTSTASSVDGSGGVDTAVQAALATIPAGVSGFELIHQAAMKTRWGMPDLDSGVDTTSAEFKQFVQKSRTAPFGGLTSYLVVMARDFGWSALDVVWETSAYTDGAPKRVYRMRDDVDMQKLIKSLDDHGFVRSGSDEQPFFRYDVRKTKAPAIFFAVTVLPEKHLLVTGESPEEVLAAITDPAASIAGDETVRRLLADAQTPEYLTLFIGADACSSVLDRVGVNVSAEQLKKLSEERAALTADWHPIDGWAAMTVNDTEAVVITDFLSPEHAEADAKARVAAVAGAESVTNGKPLSEMFTVTDSAVTGRVLRYDLTFADSAGRLANMVYSRDTPWAWCG